MTHNAELAEFSSKSIAPRDDREIFNAKYLEAQETARPAAWGAFQAGMYVLQKYAGRSPANPEAIAKANLQLLHRSLLKDPSYAQALKKVCDGTATHDLPTSHCIFANQNLRADFLTLKSGNAIRLKPYLKKCSMYLSIAGKSLIQSTNDAPENKKSWWKPRADSHHLQSLKNGDAVIILRGWNEEKQLVAKEQECILLRIQFSS